MKKFFTLLLAMVAVVAVNAKQVVFDFTNPTALGIAAPEDGKGTNISGQNLEVDGVTMSNVKVATTDTRIWNTKGAYDLRIYTNSTITFTAAENITAIEFEGTAVSFKEFSGKTWTGTEASVTLTAGATNKIKKATLTIGEAADVWTPDTISVSDANALIVAADGHDHFVYGVVMGEPFITYASFNGHASFWMADMNNANDTIEFYDGYGKGNARWASLDEAKNAIHVGDTVLVYAGALQAYTNSKTGITINEITGGYYAETLGYNPDVPEDTTVTPELPEGVISCEDAVKAAANIADPVEEKTTVEGGAIKVRGYVTYAYNASNGKQSAWLSDTKGAKSGVIEGSYLTISEAVAVGDYVELDGTLAKYKKAASGDKPAEIIIEVINGTMAKVGGTPVDPTPVALDTITVARALEIGTALADNGVSDKEYVIGGFVSSIETYFDPTYKNETFWITDEKGSRAASNAENAFYVFRGKPDTEEEIGLDAKVYVTCTIKKYVKEGKDPVIENATACDVAVVEKGQEEIVESITVAQAMELGQKLQVSDKDHSYPSEVRYEITGYVSYIHEAYSSQYGNETFWITDTKEDRTNDPAKAFEVYRGKPNTKAEICLDAKIKIVCKIKNFKGTIENDGSNIAFEVLEAGVVPDTIIVKEALAEIGNLEEGATSQDMYVVEGYIADIITPYDSQYGNLTVTMTDKFNKTTGDIMAYHAKISQNDVEKAVAGAYVQVFGYLVNHTNGAQIGSGGQITIATAPKVDTVTITVAQAAEIAAGLVEGAEADEFYVVTGYVAKLVGDQGNSFWLSDSETAEEGQLYIYMANIATPAQLHQQVRVYGWVGKNEKGNAIIREGDAEIISGEGIEQLMLTEKAQKVVVDGIVYIIRDKKMFNLQGERVR